MLSNRGGPPKPKSVIPPLSRVAAHELYQAPPLSHREAAASQRDTDVAGSPSHRAKTTEVKIYSELLTDRHSSLTEKLKAATELGNQALGDAKEDIADGKGTIEALVVLAKSKHSEQAKERAAGALRNLAVESWKNKELIASAGGIPPLVDIATNATTEAQMDFAVGALASLALDSDNKKLIAEAGGIPPLVAQVRNGHTAAIQALACVALGNLTSNEVGNTGKSNKMLINEAGGIPPLVDLAATGTMEQREAAVGALWNLAFNDANKTAIAEAGGIPPLVDLVAKGTPRQKEQAAGALANLTVDEDNRSRVVGAGGIAALVPLWTGSDGGQTERQKAFAHACLSNLAIDQFIRAKILAVASSGSETQRNREFVAQCWSKGEIAVSDDAEIEAEMAKLQVGKDGSGGSAQEGDKAAAVDVQ